MTKKSEMAEWILDFFRRAKVDAGQIVMFRSIQHKLYELNPKEQDLFMPVANELIANGYFTYEDQTPQSLRLTEKGRDYIYDPEAVLDCCQDRRRATKKDYVKVIETGLNIADVAVQGRVDNDKLCELLKQTCEVIVSVDDDELLALIDRHIMILAELRARMSDLFVSHETKETVAKAISHLDSLEEREIASHLQELT